MHPYLLCRVARIPHNPKFSLAAVLGEPVKRGEAEQMQRGKLVKCEQMQSGVQQYLKAPKLLMRSFALKAEWIIKSQG
eukprot:scaffold23558_cov17-Tisochrysis_lutea.AAC.1